MHANGRIKRVEVVSAASTMADKFEDRCVEQVISWHNGNTLSASNHPNESVWSSDVTQRRFRLYAAKSRPVVTATGSERFIKMSLYIRPSISRIESVTLKMGERVLANGRSGTRELPFCLAQRTILHPVRLTSDAPLAAPSAPSSFPLSRRDILRNADIQKLQAQKVEAVKFFFRRTPTIDHPLLSLPRSPFDAILPSTCIGRHFTPVRTCFLFLFIVASWFHLLSGERGRRTSTGWGINEAWEKKSRRKKSGEMTNNNNGGAEERENINCFVPAADGNETRWRETGNGRKGVGRVLLVINEMH